MTVEPVAGASWKRKGFERPTRSASRESGALQGCVTPKLPKKKILLPSLRNCSIFVPTLFLKETAELSGSAEALPPAALATDRSRRSVGARREQGEEPTRRSLEPPALASPRPLRGRVAAKRSRPEMLPQGPEKTEFAPGNGMASQAWNPQESSTVARRGGRPGENDSLSRTAQSCSFWLLAPNALKALSRVRILGRPAVSSAESRRPRRRLSDDRTVFALRRGSAPAGARGRTDASLGSAKRSRARTG